LIWTKLESGLVMDSFDHLDVNRHLNGLPDWTHSNAIVYTRTETCCFRCVINPGY